MTKQERDLVDYIQREREKDPNFKKLLPANTPEDLLKLAQNDMKYLNKAGLRVKKMWVSHDCNDNSKSYVVQSDIEK